MNDTMMILTRAESANPDSPLAVFKKVGKYSTQIYCVFANTYDSAKRIRLEDSNLVGVYDMNTNPKQIRKDIKGVFG